MQSPSAYTQFQLRPPYPASADRDDHRPARKSAIQRLAGKIFKRVFTPAWIREHDAEAQPKLLSPYHVDDYGRPRPLSRTEIILHSIARPILIGLIIGFGLAISVLALQHTWSAAPKEATGSLGALPEANS